MEEAATALRTDQMTIEEAWTDVSMCAPIGAEVGLSARTQLGGTARTLAGSVRSNRTTIPDLSSGGVRDPRADLFILRERSELSRNNAVKGLLASGRSLLKR